MVKKGKRILIVSSCPPAHSSNLGGAMKEKLETAGHDVSFLTKIDSDGIPKDVITVYNRKPLKKIKDRLKSFKPYLALHDGFHLIKNRLRGKTIKLNGATVVYSHQDRLKYRDERVPGVPVKDLIDKIDGEYDAVITLFWEGMLNSSSVKAIYDRLKCPVLIFSVDMSPMTGGCFYFGNCRKFSSGCGDCELVSHKVEDLTHNNYLLKKHNYRASNCAFLGNSWMIGFAEMSKLFPRIYKTEIFIDEDFFKPGDISISRQKFGIDPEKKFVILIRSSFEPRKGAPDLIKILTNFISALDERQRNEIEILSIGDDYVGKISPVLKLYIRNAGFVNQKGLRDAYRAADVFLNVSLDDAGPSMVNQALMCGTPVICYDNGTAIDVVDDGVSGFKTETGDVKSLSSKLLHLYEMDRQGRKKLSDNSRKMALKHNSAQVFVKRIEEIIMDMGKVEVSQKDLTN